MDTRAPLPVRSRTDRLRARHFAARVDWARRNPRLLFRLSAVFLLRTAERTFLGLLFQEPPRTTRRPPYGLLPFLNTVSENILSRNPRVSACRAWPIQLCTEGLNSCHSIRPVA
jgi:hypothetical protein